ncbi:MAG: histidinol-phosphate transaminase [Nitrospirota bacterium]|nr:histidinol-phosphate transaminase [Nitrospirota bacterium]
MIRPPEYVREIQPYIPGKPVEELERELGISGSIKLASNENPTGPSPRALAAVKNSIADLNRYPDGSGYYLRKRLSEKLAVGEEELILGNGSNQLIDIAVRTFLKAGDNAVMAAPSFVVYSMAVQAVGGKPVRVPLKNHTHDLNAMADSINPETRMIFIANPNNPTGTIIRKDEFDGFMERVPDDLLVVLDEAYYEYVSDPDYASGIGRLRNGKNILVLRTFSKIYGLAGLRMGYGMAKEEIISEMHRIRDPFNTNTLAQKAAIEALNDEEHVRRSRALNEEGKKYLYREFSSINIKYVPTEANFIYISTKSTSGVIYEKLLRKGIIVRPVGPNEIRVTIGLPEENRRLIDELRQLMLDGPVVSG